jgi:hypothetical protein
MGSWARIVEVQITEVKGYRADTLMGILSCFGEGEGGIHVLYSDRSFKWLAVCVVTEEMLNYKYKLLSTPAAGIKHLYLT